MKGTTHRGLTNQEDLQEAWLEADPKNREKYDDRRPPPQWRTDFEIEKSRWPISAKSSNTPPFGRWPRPLKVAYELKSTWSKPSGVSSCGSITGAPKIFTMESSKTEKSPRGVHCGTIGILLPKGKRIFNVAIRTLQMGGDQLHLWRGRRHHLGTANGKWIPGNQAKIGCLYRQEPPLSSWRLAASTKESWLSRPTCNTLEKLSRYFAYLLMMSRSSWKNFKKNCSFRSQPWLSLSGLPCKKRDLHLEITELTDLPASYLQAQLTDRSSI